MKIILFRFEKENINFLECTVDSGNLIIGDKGKIPLISMEANGEKYNKAWDELLLIYTKYSPDSLSYQSPQPYMGRIMDMEGFAISVILKLFCYQNKIDLLELTQKIVKDKLSIPKKDFKNTFDRERTNVISKYKIAKSDKLLEGLTFLSLLKSVL